MKIEKGNIKIINFTISVFDLQLDKVFKLGNRLQFNKCEQSLREREGKIKRVYKNNCRGAQVRETIG